VQLPSRPEFERYFRSAISIRSTSTAAVPECPATTPSKLWRLNAGIYEGYGSGFSLIENVNLRPWEPVAPGVNPIASMIRRRFDYQISKDWAFEPATIVAPRPPPLRSIVYDPNWGETYTIVTPGGREQDIEGYANS